MKIKVKQLVGLAAAVAGIHALEAEERQLRPLSTDRPDATESAYTVDKGHFQLEMEMAAVTRDGSNDSYSVGEMNFKYGISTDADIQFVLPVYEHVGSGPEGFGDMQVRVKKNLLGNDDGDTALAIMPFVQIPTGRSGITSGEVEGGVILPLSLQGANGWGYGLQVEADLVADEVGAGHHFEFLTSATAAYDLTEKTGLFIEIVGILGEGSEATEEAYFNTGLTWLADDFVQLDGGLRVGLTNDSEDFTPFMGISVKF